MTTFFPQRKGNSSASLSISPKQRGPSKSVLVTDALRKKALADKLNSYEAEFQKSRARDELDRKIKSLS